jgi:3'-phosphoadenosine 5'-phosphosulfate sulfotransferase
MNQKQIFLELNREITNGGNPHRRVLSKDETRMFNYRSGISSAIRQENRGKELQFFQALNHLYSETNFPLLTISSTLLLFRKFNINQYVFNCLEYTFNELGTQDFVNEPKFWEHYLHFFSLNTRDDLKSKQPQLLAFSKIAKLLFKNSNYQNYNILFGYLLNHSREMVLRSLTHYQLGSNTLGHFAIDGKIKSLGSLLKLFSILKKSKAEPKVFEMFLIHLSNSKKDFFAREEQFREFLVVFLDKFPAEFLGKMNALDLDKLYIIYKLNSKLFENFNPEECQNFRQVNSTKYGLLRSEIVNYLLAKYGISFFFIKNFNEDKLSSVELNWFKDVVSGKNLVYSENLPFELNKKVVHKFNTVSNEWKREAIESNYIMVELWDNSKRELSVFDGLIWSVILFETQNVIYTNEVLGYIRATSNTPFWVKVVVQLYRNGLRTRNHRITEIFDYIDYQVFHLRRVINFKNKKIANLAAESNEWHEAVGNFKYGRLEKLIKLPKSSLPSFEYEDENENKKYIIRQILTNRELAYEGGELGHCVGTYTNKCINYGTFIYSLREVFEYYEKDQTDEGEIEVVRTIEKSLITIELNRNTIVQKRGKKNRLCLPLEDRIIKIWAKENKFIIRSY